MSANRELYLPQKPAEERTASPRRRRTPGKFSMKLDATIPARLSAISTLVDAVMTVVRQQAKAKESEIETALREALSNAIRHGCSGDPTKFVQCSVVFEAEHSVLIVVRDPGPGFNPKSLPNPTEGMHLYENHGRGIYLINHLMDEVHFKRGGAEIHMRSRL
jgi:serine/threonine-protein kinase RsbW